MRAREVVTGGLLTGLAVLIPVVFRGYLQVVIPPFSATLFSHVPEMIAVLVSPAVALFVGLGSAFGFLVTLGPIVAARALVHAAWGIAGALLVRRGWPYAGVLVAALPVHALGEALVVLAFGLPPAFAFVQVGIGTALHHVVDAVAAAALARALRAALVSAVAPVRLAEKKH